MAELETDIGLDIDDGFYSTTSSGVVQTPQKQDFYQLTFPIEDEDEIYLDDGIQDVKTLSKCRDLITLFQVNNEENNASGIQAKVFCDNMVDIYVPYDSPTVPLFSLNSWKSVFNYFKFVIQDLPIPIFSFFVVWLVLHNYEK